MKLALILLAIVVLCLVNDSDAFQRRVQRKINRFLPRLKKGGCKVCPRLCRTLIGIGFACRFVCRRVCRGKRAAVKESPHHVTPLANQLSAYDLNDDGLISKKELASAVGEIETNPDFILAYKSADINDDGILTPKEFYNGPFVFEMDLNDDDLQYCRYRLDIDDDLVDFIEGTEIVQGPNFIDGKAVKKTEKPINGTA
ncbi:hypothetical protein SNE40_009021 [Patella caerulea]|uniref:EF-hand domain-containing protein n=1 Tax=Patella caerulea TaxID=87958 RepID=A0AAN8JWW4_PATCE